MLLGRFSRKEWQSFIDFCQSPYFNRDERIHHLLSYLDTFFPDFPADCLNLEKLPKNIFGKEGRNKKRFSYIKSDTLRLARNFLGQEQLRQDDYQLTVASAQSLLKRAPAMGVAILEKVKQELDAEAESGHEQVLREFQINDLLHSLKAHEKGTGESLLQASIDNLEEFYLIHKLSYSCEIENRSRIMREAEPFRNPLMPAIEGDLHLRQEMAPLTALYFRLYLTTKYEEEETYFDKLVQLVQNTPVTAIEPVEFRSIQLATINIGLRKMRAQPEKYRSVCLQLYEDGIRSKVLFENGQLSEWTYQNAIRLGLMSKRYDWTEQFIHHYNNFLAAQSQSNALHSNLAELFFYKKDYDASLDHLNQIDTTHFKYYINPKILLVKVFYEKGNLDSCLWNLGSLTVYLSRRKDVTKTLRKGYQHFCQLLHRILMQSSSKKIRQIQDKIQTLTPLAERNWLQDVFNREFPRA